VSVMGTKRLSMKIIDNKDKIKVDPSSIPLYGRAWKQTWQCKPAAYLVSDSAFLIQFLCSILILFSLHRLWLTVSLYCVSSIQQSYFGLVV
jgi:hypothetical protein